MKKIQLHLTPKQTAWLQASAMVVFTTLLSLLLTSFIFTDFLSLEMFAPMEKKVDFQLSDIYNSVEANRPIKTLSNDVVVVNIDGCDREGALTTVMQVAQCEPKAIGLDVMFPISKDSAQNNHLKTIISAVDQLVFSTGVKYDTSTGVYSRDFFSFCELDEDFAPHHFGYVNLDTSRPWEVVRSFVPFVVTPDGDTLRSMTFELARIASPERAQELVARHRFAETIDYTSYEIDTINAADLNDPYEQRKLKDKVVLIGAMSEVKDTYLTPLRKPQAGVMIHAQVVQTILSGTYIRESSAWFNWFFAIVLCMTFITLLRIARKRMSNVGNLLIRISQFAIMFGLVWLGCYIYSVHHLYMDFTPAIWMLGLGAIAFDLTFAVYGIIRNIIHATHQIHLKK